MESIKVKIFFVQSVQWKNCNDHPMLHLLPVIVAAVTWLEYCRYGVKPKTVNQSITPKLITIVMYGSFLDY